MIRWLVFLCMVQMTVLLGLAQDTVFTVLESPQTVSFQAGRGIVTYDIDGSRSVSGVAAAGYRISQELPQRGDWLTLRYYPQGEIQSDTLPVPMGDVAKVAYYMVRVPAEVDSSAPEEPAPPDSTNLLDGLSWRHILYDAQGSFINNGDTLLRADTWQIPGVHAHTPQIVASGWEVEKGDSLYAQFQVRGTIEQFRLDINTGPVGPRSWAFHYSDTFPVTPTWTWHTAAFQAQYTDEDNRFDFNIGIDTGQVEFRNVSLTRFKPTNITSPDTSEDVRPDPISPDTIYLTRVDTFYQVDTLYITELDTVEIVETIVERDTIQLPPLPPDTLYLTRVDTLFRTVTDTLRDTLFLKPDVYIIQEVEGKEVDRKKIN